MGVLKKHQPVVKKKSSCTKAQRKHRRQENQKLAQQVVERIRDATEPVTRTRQLPFVTQVSSQAAGSPHLYICCR